MKLFNTILLSALLLAMWGLFSATALAQASPLLDGERTGVAPEVFQQQILIKVEPSVTEAELSDILAPYGLKGITNWIPPKLIAYNRFGPLRKPTARQAEAQQMLQGLAHIYVAVYSEPIAPTVVASNIRHTPGIVYAEAVYKRRLHYIPNDERIGLQPHLEQIRAFEAWDNARADASILIAIVDSGIDPLHPDLEEAIWNNPGETGMDGAGKDKRTNGIDDDQNGFIDDWYGYDFSGPNGRTTDNSPLDMYRHGTHVAGIAAARGDNATGVAGVAYGATIMPVKVTDEPATTDPVIYNGYTGILYAAQMGARIVNCSWGSAGYSQAEQEVMNTVTAMGTLVVASAGNEASPIQVFPASYPNVISVASVKQSDERSTFSNYNYTIGLSAPGEFVYSTIPTYLSGTIYGYISGTSMSAPMVAGAAALVAAKYRDSHLTPEEITAILKASADDISGANAQIDHLQLGSGRLNVERAVINGPNALFTDIIDITATDSNDDGLIEPGEKTELRATLRNVLRPASDIRLRLESNANPNLVTIESPLETIGDMGTGETRRSSPGSFTVSTSVETPLDFIVPLTFTILERGKAIQSQHIEITVNPNYSTTYTNKLITTITGNGRIGFNDIPINTTGKGFILDSADNILAEGGILIGVAADRLADVVRSGQDDGLPSNGLQTVEPYRVRYYDEEKVQIGTARFNDTHLHELQRIGLDVQLTSYAYQIPGLERQLLLAYRITNTSGRILDNLHAALYFDWDIGPRGADNQATFDPQNRMGYTANVRQGGYPITGVMLVSEQQLNFNAMDNNASPLSGGFFQIEKWNAISSGIQAERSSIGDCSVIIGAGPITLQPGADTVIVFSVMGAGNLTELQGLAARVRELYERTGGTPGGPVIIPRNLELAIISQNPFSDCAVIQYTMPEAGDVQINIYDPAGKLVQQLVNQKKSKGIHTIEFQPESAYSSVYLITMDALHTTLTRKLINFRF